MVVLVDCGLCIMLLIGDNFELVVVVVICVGIDEVIVDILLEGKVDVIE